ncbi:MAG: HisA/HisF-related TIM barrel protein [Chitinophagales bacterium]|nr:HisA/HisF-related TIM barrel protein [Chitinophagales bacterium]
MSFESEFALLIDPEKFDFQGKLAQYIKNFPPDLILVGASAHVSRAFFEAFVSKLKATFSTPIWLFPGSTDQFSLLADGILLLQVLQSFDVDYTLKPVYEICDALYDSKMTRLMTAYLLINDKNESSTYKHTQIPFVSYSEQKQIEKLLKTSAIMNFEAIYLESGSGAEKTIDASLIELAKKISPSARLFVGGGIRSLQSYERIQNSGADTIVIGNAFEENPDFLPELHTFIKDSRH